MGYQENQMFRKLMFMHAMWDQTKKNYLENETFVPYIYALAKDKMGEANMVCATELPVTQHLTGIDLIAERFKTKVIINSFLEKVKEEDIDILATFQSELIVDEDGSHQIITIRKIADKEIVKTYRVIHTSASISGDGEMVSSIDFQHEEDE